MGSGETAPPSKVPPKASSAQVKSYRLEVAYILDWIQFVSVVIIEFVQEQTPTSSSPATTAASSSAVVYPDWSGFQVNHLK